MAIPISESDYKSLVRTSTAVQKTTLQSRSVRMSKQIN